MQFLFPQDAPQHFADHRLRQFLTEFDQARHLEGSQFLATEGHDFRYGQIRPFLRDDIRLDGFTTGAVINAHGNGFPNFWVRVEDFIDFTRIDVITTDDDQILFTVDNVEITFFIHVGDIAGVQPAVADGPGGFFRAVPIALHNLRPLDDQLPDLIVSQNPFTVFRVDNTGEGSGNRHTYGTRLLLPKHGVGMGNGRSLGQPKAFRNGRARHFFEFLQPFDRHRG